jgi:hypothetical protein
MVMNEAASAPVVLRKVSQLRSIPHTELADPTSSYRRGHAAASLVQFVEKFFKPSDTSGPRSSSGVYVFSSA